MEDVAKSFERQTDPPPNPGNVSALSVPLKSYFEWPKQGTVVAIGDLHGDLGAARRCLELSDCVSFDEAGEPTWIGGDSVVVILGDVVDRLRPGSLTIPVPRKGKLPLARGAGEEDREEKRLLQMLNSLAAEPLPAGGQKHLLSRNGICLVLRVAFAVFPCGLFRLPV
jgi:hypothetical protein